MNRNKVRKLLIEYKKVNKLTYDWLSVRIFGNTKKASMIRAFMIGSGKTRQGNYLAIRNYVVLEDRHRKTKRNRLIFDKLRYVFAIVILMYVIMITAYIITALINAV